MLIRAISPHWAMEEDPTRRKVYEGDYEESFIQRLNDDNYNIYFLPNYPQIYNPGTPVDGSDIDTFEWVFVDMDLKDEIFKDKDEFIASLSDFPLTPSKIVDSGNGIHVYWRVLDLDAKSFLRLQRRLVRRLRTDENICKIYQLMRLPGYVNPKHRGAPKSCELIFLSDNEYTSDELDAALPSITSEDEAYCKDHFDKTYDVKEAINIDETLPPKFYDLMRNNDEAKTIWSGGSDDRSKADYRLAHIMLAYGFTKQEATSVLVNTAKALARAPKHRIAYATNIIEKIFQPETGFKLLSSSVADMLSKGEEALEGTRFACHKYLDNTVAGFRLGQVVGLVAGAGVGKTAICLNAFKGFVVNNPEYIHLFVSLEQPKREIALRWHAMNKDNSFINNKVHILDNYDDQGKLRRLTLKMIWDYINEFQMATKQKIGCVAIDHIGIIKSDNKHSDFSGLMDICENMKAMAEETNTMIIMLSQSPREKAGVGDLELDKDAAYGTAKFEWYVDYLITMWQPLKRMYKEGAPTVTAYKFCKIRHKKVNEDVIQEDKRYMLFFDPNTQELKEMTQEQVASFSFWNGRAVNERKSDRKTEIVAYDAAKFTKGDLNDGKPNNNQNTTPIPRTVRIH